MMKFAKLVCCLCVATFVNAQEMPQQWFNLDPADGYQGVSTYKVYEELLKDKVGETVVVAIIDSGVDIEHEDLADNIWVNPGEIPNNGIDDDRNGYVDDVHGWNFIGGPDGKNVGPDSYEVTRVYGKLKYKYENADPAKLNKKQKKEYELYLKTKEEVESELKKAEATLEQIRGIEENVMNGLDKLEGILKDQNLTLADIDSIDVSSDPAMNIASRIYSQVKEGNPDVKTVQDVRDGFAVMLAGDKEYFENKTKYAYNTEFDPRKTIVKDDYDDQNERIYGNNDVEGPDALHGTHVAGIVGAVSNNGIGMDGIARNVKLMSVRTVPDGDERDKDVANAIRYAVDNGASIINMSFGKGYSWEESIVEDAIKHALKNDVLLVHAAGNSAQDNDTASNFPNDNYKKRFLFWKRDKEFANWLEIGALSFKKGEDMVATFSNYGQKNVDVFSPGVKIYSTVPDNKYRNLQGTSMAAPAAAGVAAVIRSQYPSLTAVQVKDILMKSSIKMDDMVKNPTTGEKVPFSSLSVSGGVVNLYKALQLASQTKGKKKVKKQGA